MDKQSGLPDAFLCIRATALPPPPCRRPQPITSQAAAHYHPPRCTIIGTGRTLLAFVEESGLPVDKVWANVCAGSDEGVCEAEGDQLTRRNHDCFLNQLREVLVQLEGELDLIDELELDPPSKRAVEACSRHDTIEFGRVRRSARTTAGAVSVKANCYACMRLMRTSRETKEAECRFHLRWIHQCDVLLFHCAKNA